MIIDITIPSPGESIAEVELAAWLAEDGAYVEKDQEIAEVESDKATLPLIAQKAGTLKHLVKEGQTIPVGTVACSIDTSAKAPVKTSTSNEGSAKTARKEEAEMKKESPKEEKPDIKATPLARKMMAEHNLRVEDLVKGLRKITTKDINTVLQQKNSIAQKSEQPVSREVHRENMSQLRKKLGRRLVAVKNETAMLTTFNEVDMSTIISLRKKYQKAFTEAHGVKLGFMSFFTKAVTEALQVFPKVNSMMNDDKIVNPQYVDVAIAVQTDKGLMVPVLRNTEAMSLADMEKHIVDLADKARKFRLSIEEMSGGTFTITNGGVFGSMLSTPILNPPQAAILGMHNIVERPVAIGGRVEIRPIMYIALSYDHRLVDGRDSVSFLVKVKELLEAPLSIIHSASSKETI